MCKLNFQTAEEQHNFDIKHVFAWWTDWTAILVHSFIGIDKQMEYVGGGSEWFSDVWAVIFCFLFNFTYKIKKKNSENI